MDDDFFADLLGSTGTTTGIKPAPQTTPAATSSQPGRTAVAENNGAHKHADAKHDTYPQAQASAEESKHETTVSVSREELEQLIKTSVAAAMDANFGKFVRSLRTVLEDMTKRIEGTGSACEQLKAQFEQLRDVYDSQSENFHTRFSQVDVAIREVERGVQSLRDKQELAEAQAMLAKLSQDQQEAKAKAAAAAAPSPASEPAAPPAAAAVPAAPLPAASAALAAPASPQQAQHAPQAPPAAPEPLQQQYSAQLPPPQQQQQQPQQQYPGHYSHPPPGSSATDAYNGAMPPAPAQRQGSYSAPPAPQQYQQPPPMAPAMQGPPVPGPMQQPPPLQGPPPPHQAPPMPMPPPPTHQPPPMSMPPPTQQGPAPAVNYPLPMSPYPAPHASSLYPQAPPPMRPHGPGPMGHPPPMASAGGAPPQARTQTRTVPLEQIISDIAHMGFERHQVMAVVNQLQQAGQSVDLNVILDRLTNGRY